MSSQSRSLAHLYPTYDTKSTNTYRTRLCQQMAMHLGEPQAAAVQSGSDFTLGPSDLKSVSYSFPEFPACSKHLHASYAS